MIYVHSLGRASRYYPQRTALVVGGAAVSFKALDERVQNIAAALAANGFRAGDRLALLLPNSPQPKSIEFCLMQNRVAWCGIPRSRSLRSRFRGNSCSMKSPSTFRMSPVQ